MGISEVEKGREEKKIVNFFQLNFFSTIQGDLSTVAIYVFAGFGIAIACARGTLH